MNIKVFCQWSFVTFLIIYAFLTALLKNLNQLQVLSWREFELTGTDDSELTHNLNSNPDFDFFNRRLAMIYPEPVKSPDSSISSDKRYLQYCFKMVQLTLQIRE